MYILLFFLPPFDVFMHISPTFISLALVDTLAFFMNSTSAPPLHTALEEDARQILDPSENSSGK